ncbi:hypothetical protein IL306_013120 [Fusarium sp. DS 682]|nr:hypothetical protein IL306_013120 [Fusarium sp. DS 682]
MHCTYIPLASITPRLERYMNWVSAALDSTLLNMESKTKLAEATTTAGSNVSVVFEDAQPRPTSPFKRLLYHLWDNDQHLKSPEERKLARKLDFGILICATLGWVCYNV